ncbi:MAG TPA: PLP-dependent aminotransferase family protein [Longimicrobium sp.]|nr:PLP-dependent aminotransferase family protein [Longimicrobium sp.]
MRTAAGPEILALVPLDRGSRVPLHQQIYDGLRRAMLEGMLRAGQRVPSTRVLATELGVSRFPVLTAYDQLLHEGYLEGRVGAGTFVRAAPPDDAFRPAPAARRASAPANVPPPPYAPGDAPRTPRPPAWPASGEDPVRPFRTTVPALDRFPHALWARLVARHAHRLAPIHMAYGHPAGLGGLRAAIAEHLRTTRAVRCEPDDVLVVSGSQAALRLCAAVLVGHGDRVAIEEPGYPGAHAALAAGGAELVPVPVDGEGLVVEALRADSREIRAVYVTPSHQHPLGAPMSAPRRLALLDWAARRQAWVLEDDYDSEYRYVSRPLAALQGMDAHGRVVYIGTFSKVLFPALRVGYLVVPPALREAFAAARDALDIFSPTLYQLALADFLSEGHFARHLRRMRGIYLARRGALLAGLARHCAGVLAVHNADAGLHVATLLPEGTDDVEVVFRMAAHGLTASALSTCYLGPARRPGLLLGFGGFGEATLEAATRTLGNLLRGEGGQEEAGREVVMGGRG